MIESGTTQSIMMVVIAKCDEKKFQISVWVEDLMLLPPLANKHVMFKTITEIL